MSSAQTAGVCPMLWVHKEVGEPTPFDGYYIREAGLVLDRYHFLGASEARIEYLDEVWRIKSPVTGVMINRFVVPNSDDALIPPTLDIWDYTLNGREWTTYTDVMIECISWRDVDWTRSPTTSRPTLEPTLPVPSDAPVINPSQFPSFNPSISSPTRRPTPGPSELPSNSPSTSRPTKRPTDSPTPPPSDRPTGSPQTSQPTHIPSEEPSEQPSFLPTGGPIQSPSKRPSEEPSHTPSESPSYKPTRTPSRSPSVTPTPSPTPLPTSAPVSSKPTRTPSSRPSQLPSRTPSGCPSAAPTATDPTHNPSILPTMIPSGTPSKCPSGKPTFTEPTFHPSNQPSITPSGTPSRVPTYAPSYSIPTNVPSSRPSIVPSRTPSKSPTGAPTFSKPTFNPSSQPSIIPSGTPSTCPTGEPSFTEPTSDPSNQPSIKPSETPSRVPTYAPSYSMPTDIPSSRPSIVPSRSPSTTPSSKPSFTCPTLFPSFRPSIVPSGTPSKLPTSNPSYSRPTFYPSCAPSIMPSGAPSTRPSHSPLFSIPTVYPSLMPSITPSRNPTTKPSSQPSSDMPSSFPSFIPSTAPSRKPTTNPSCEPSSDLPSSSPSLIPSITPSREPSTDPSCEPSYDSPSASPSFIPSSAPSRKPSSLPTTDEPSLSPNDSPSTTPSLSPTELACDYIRVYTGPCDDPRGMDIVFVIDADSSATSTEFSLLLSFAAAFLNQNVRDDARFSLLSFSGTPSLDLILNEEGPDVWTSAIESLTQKSTAGTLGSALSAGLAMLNSQSDGRVSVLVVMVDVASLADVCSYASLVEDTEVIFLLIGSVSSDQLDGITCVATNWYFQSSYQTLTVGEPSLYLCGAITPFNGDYAIGPAMLNGKYTFGNATASFYHDGETWNIESSNSDRMIARSSPPQEMPPEVDMWDFISVGNNGISKLYVDVYTMCYATIDPSRSPSTTPSTTAEPSSNPIMSPCQVVHFGEGYEDIFFNGVYTRNGTIYNGKPVYSTPDGSRCIMWQDEAWTFRHDEHGVMQSLNSSLEELYETMTWLFLSTNGTRHVYEDVPSRCETNSPTLMPSMAPTENCPHFYIGEQCITITTGVDAAFIIDSSSSISDEDFNIVLDSLAASVEGYWPEDNSYYALVLFSDDVDVKIPLTSGSRATLASQIRGLERLQGATMTRNAFIRTFEDVWQDNIDQNRVQATFLVTDGIPSQGQDPCDQISVYQDAGIGLRVIAVAEADTNLNQGDTVFQCFIDADIPIIGFSTFIESQDALIQTIQYITVECDHGTIITPFDGGYHQTGAQWNGYFVYQSDSGWQAIWQDRSWQFIDPTSAIQGILFDTSLSNAAWPEDGHDWTYFEGFDRTTYTNVPIRCESPRPTRSPSAHPTRSPTFSPSVCPTRTPSSLPTTFMPTPCTPIVLCDVGPHQPDSTFSGWYARTDAMSAVGRPVWVKVDSTVTISYTDGWSFVDPQGDVMKALHPSEGMYPKDGVDWLFGSTQGERTDVTNLSIRCTCARSPTSMPSKFPQTSIPTGSPTLSAPSRFPSSSNPSSIPTSPNPSMRPTATLPSALPSILPTLFPTSETPSKSPSVSSPSNSPSTAEPTKTPSIDPTFAPSDFNCGVVCVENGAYNGLLYLEDTLVNGYPWWTSADNSLSLRVEVNTAASISEKWFMWVPVGYMVFDGEVERSCPQNGDWVLVNDATGVLATYSNVMMTCNGCTQSKPSTAPQDDLLPGTATLAPSAQPTEMCNAIEVGNPYTENEFAGPYGLIGYENGHGVYYNRFLDATLKYENDAWVFHSPVFGEMVASTSEHFLEPQPWVFVADGFTYDSVPIYCFTRSPVQSPSYTECSPEDFVVCHVGTHNPEDSFTGWYRRTEDMSENRPVWVHVDEDKTLLFEETWVFIHSLYYMQAITGNDGPTPETNMDWAFSFANGGSITVIYGLSIDCACTFAPTTAPSRIPSGTPSKVPSATFPSNIPTSPPSRIPSTTPFHHPSLSPSFIPTQPPSKSPSYTPIGTPSGTPSFAFPSKTPSETPSFIPSTQPTEFPSVTHSLSPSFIPSTQPTPSSPSTRPSQSPSNKPTTIPSHFPTYTPSHTPSVAPHTSPSRPPTLKDTPSHFPTQSPVTSPSRSPTIQPSQKPSNVPSGLPSLAPITGAPSTGPSKYPSHTPSNTPTYIPSENPSFPPSSTPSESPTSQPSLMPSMSPSENPTIPPTNIPSGSPSHTPSIIPNMNPSEPPNTSPSNMPSVLPTSNPSESPINAPSNSPNMNPSETPTSPPSSIPSVFPTSNPSKSPSNTPSNSPSEFPTHTPSKLPSNKPTHSPTYTPSSYPSVFPSKMPSRFPSHAPSDFPTNAPSHAPSVFPTSAPSHSPSAFPTNAPSHAPSAFPTNTPSLKPSKSPISQEPSVSPSCKPTSTPSTTPFFSPTVTPSRIPTITPSKLPTIPFPSQSPSEAPFTGPTISPSGAPTCSPSNSPTESMPSNAPTASDPSTAPTSFPSTSPSKSPTEFTCYCLTFASDDDVCDGFNGMYDYVDNSLWTHMSKQDMTLSIEDTNDGPRWRFHQAPWKILSGEAPTLPYPAGDETWNFYLNVAMIPDRSNITCNDAMSCSPFPCTFAPTSFPTDSFPSNSPSFSAPSTSPSKFPSTSPSRYPSVSPSRMPSSSPFTPAPTPVCRVITFNCGSPYDGQYTLDSSSIDISYRGPTGSLTSVVISTHGASWKWDRFDDPSPTHYLIAPFTQDMPSIKDWTRVTSSSPFEHISSITCPPLDCSESFIPTSTPSNLPSALPTTNPSRGPSITPFVSTPTISPSTSPTGCPSTVPSFFPSTTPTESPTDMPTDMCSYLIVGCDDYPPHTPFDGVYELEDTTLNDKSRWYNYDLGVTMLYSISVGHQWLLRQDGGDLLVSEDDASEQSIPRTGRTWCFFNDTQIQVDGRCIDDVCISCTESGSPTILPSRIPSITPSSKPSVSLPSVTPSTGPSSDQPSQTPTTNLPSTPPSAALPSITPTISTPSASPSSSAPTATPSQSFPTASPTLSLPTSLPSDLNPSISPTSSFPSIEPSHMCGIFPQNMPGWEEIVDRESEIWDFQGKEYDDCPWFIIKCAIVTIRNLTMRCNDTGSAETNAFIQAYDRELVVFESTTFIATDGQQCLYTDNGNVIVRDSSFGNCHSSSFNGGNVLLENSVFEESGTIEIENSNITLNDVTLDGSAGIQASGSGSETATINGLTLNGINFGAGRRRLSKAETGSYLDAIDFLFTFSNYGELTITDVEITEISNPFLYVGETGSLSLKDFYFHHSETNTTIFDCGDVNIQRVTMDTMTSADYVVSCKYCEKVVFDEISVTNSLAGIEAAYSNAELINSAFVDVESGSVFEGSDVTIRNVYMERSRGVISRQTNLIASDIVMVDSVGFYADGDGDVDVQVRDINVTSQKNTPFPGEYILRFDNFDAFALQHVQANVFNPLLETRHMNSLLLHSMDVVNSETNIDVSATELVMFNVHFDQVRTHNDSGKPLLKIDGGEVGSGNSQIMDSSFRNTDFMYFANGRFDIQDVYMYGSKGFVAENLDINGENLVLDSCDAFFGTGSGRESAVFTNINVTGSLSKTFTFQAYDNVEFYKLNPSDLSDSLFEGKDLGRVKFQDWDVSDSNTAITINGASSFEFLDAQFINTLGTELLSISNASSAIVENVNFHSTGRISIHSGDLTMRNVKLSTSSSLNLQSENGALSLNDTTVHNTPTTLSVADGSLSILDSRFTDVMSSKFLEMRGDITSAEIVDVELKAIGNITNQILNDLSIQRVNMTMLDSIASFGIVDNVVFRDILVHDSIAEFNFDSVKSFELASSGFSNIDGSETISILKGEKITIRDSLFDSTGGINLNSKDVAISNVDILSGMVSLKSDGESLKLVNVNVEDAPTSMEVSRGSVSVVESSFINAYNTVFLQLYNTDIAEIIDCSLDSIGNLVGTHMNSFDIQTVGIRNSNPWFSFGTIGDFVMSDVKFEETDARVYLNGVDTVVVNKTESQGIFHFDSIGEGGNVEFKKSFFSDKTRITIKDPSVVSISDVAVDDLEVLHVASTSVNIGGVKFGGEGNLTIDMSEAEIVNSEISIDLFSSIGSSLSINDSSLMNADEIYLNVAEVGLRDVFVVNTDTVVLKDTSIDALRLTLDESKRIVASGDKSQAARFSDLTMQIYQDEVDSRFSFTGYDEVRFEGLETTLGNNFLVGLDIGNVVLEDVAIVNSISDVLTLTDIGDLMLNRCVLNNIESSGHSMKVEIRGRVDIMDSEFTSIDQAIFTGGSMYMRSTNVTETGGFETEDMDVHISNVQFVNTPGFSSNGGGSKDASLSGLTISGQPRRRSLQSMQSIFRFGNFITFSFVDSDISTQLPLLHVQNVSEADVQRLSVYNAVTCFVFKNIATALKLYNVTLDNVQGGINPVMQIMAAASADIKDVQATRNGGVKLFDFVDSEVNMENWRSDETLTDQSVVFIRGGKLEMKQAVVDFNRGTFLDAEDADVMLDHGKITSGSDFTFVIVRGSAVLQNSIVDQLDGDFTLSTPLLVSENPNVTYSTMEILCNYYTTSCYVDEPTEIIYTCSACPAGEFPDGIPHFMDTNVTGGWCSPCGKNVICDVANRDARTHWWLDLVEEKIPKECGRSETVEKSKVYLCPPGYCKEHSIRGDYCHDGRTGDLCGRCLEGYSQGLAGGDCFPNEECNHMSFFLGCAFFYMLLVVAFLLFMSPHPQFACVRHIIWMMQAASYCFHPYYPSLPHLLPVFLIFRFDFISAYKFREHDMCIMEDMESIDLRYVSTWVLCTIPLLTMLFYKFIDRHEYIHNKSIWYILTEYSVYVLPVLFQNQLESMNCMHIEGDTRLWNEGDDVCSSMWPMSSTTLIPFMIFAIYLGMILAHYISFSDDVGHTFYVILRAYPHLFFWLFMLILRMVIVACLVPYILPGTRMSLNILLLLIFVFCILYECSNRTYKKIADLLRMEREAKIQNMLHEYYDTMNDQQKFPKAPIPYGGPRDVETIGGEEFSEETRTDDDSWVIESHHSHSIQDEIEHEDSMSMSFDRSEGSSQFMGGEKVMLPSSFSNDPEHLYMDQSPKRYVKREPNSSHPSVIYEAGEPYSKRDPSEGGALYMDPDHDGHEFHGKREPYGYGGNAQYGEENPYYVDYYTSYDPYGGNAQYDEDETTEITDEHQAYRTRGEGDSDEPVFEIKRPKFLHLNLDNLDYYHFYILTLFAVLALVAFLFNEAMHNGVDPLSELDGIQSTIMILLLLHFIWVILEWEMQDLSPDEFPVWSIEHSETESTYEEVLPHAPPPPVPQVIHYHHAPEHVPRSWGSETEERTPPMSDTDYTNWYDQMVESSEPSDYDETVTSHGTYEDSDRKTSDTDYGPYHDDRMVHYDPYMHDPQLVVVERVEEYSAKPILEDRMKAHNHRPTPSDSMYQRPKTVRVLVGNMTPRETKNLAFSLHDDDPSEDDFLRDAMQDTKHSRGVSSSTAQHLLTDAMEHTVHQRALTDSVQFVPLELRDHMESSVENPLPHPCYMTLAQDLPFFENEESSLSQKKRGPDRPRSVGLPKRKRRAQKPLLIEPNEGKEPPKATKRKVKGEPDVDPYTTMEGIAKPPPVNEKKGLPLPVPNRKRKERPEGPPFADEGPSLLKRRIENLAAKKDEPVAKPLGLRKKRRKKPKVQLEDPKEVEEPHAKVETTHHVIEEDPNPHIDDLGMYSTPREIPKVAEPRVMSNAPEPRIAKQAFIPDISNSLHVPDIAGPHVAPEIVEPESPEVAEPIGIIPKKKRRRPEGEMSLNEPEKREPVHAKTSHEVVEDDKDPHIDDLNMYSKGKSPKAATPMIFHPRKPRRRPEGVISLDEPESKEPVHAKTSHEIVEDDKDPHIDDLKMYATDKDISDKKESDEPVLQKLDTSRRRKRKPKVAIEDERPPPEVRKKTSHKVVEDDGDPHIDDFSMYSTSKEVTVATLSKIDTTHRRKARGKMNLAEAQELSRLHKRDPLHRVVEDDGDPHIDDLNMYALSKPVPVETHDDSDETLTETTSMLELTSEESLSEQETNPGEPVRFDSPHKKRRNRGGMKLQESPQVGITKGNIDHTLDEAEEDPHIDDLHMYSKGKHLDPSSQNRNERGISVNVENLDSLNPGHPMYGVESSADTDPLQMNMLRVSASPDNDDSFMELLDQNKQEYRKLGRRTSLHNPKQSLTYSLGGEDDQQEHKFFNNPFNDDTSSADSNSDFTEDDYTPRAHDITPSGSEENRKGRRRARMRGSSAASLPSIREKHEGDQDLSSDSQTRRPNVRAISLDTIDDSSDELNIDDDHHEDFHKQAVIHVDSDLTRSQIDLLAKNIILDEDDLKNIESDEKALELLGTAEDPTMRSADSNIQKLLKMAKKDSRVRFADIDTHVPHPSELDATPTYEKSKVAKKNVLKSSAFNSPVSMEETSPSSSDSEGSLEAADFMNQEDEMDAAAAIEEYEKALATTEHDIIDFLEHEHPEYADEIEDSSTHESEEEVAAAIVEHDAVPAIVEHDVDNTPQYQSPEYSDEIEESSSDRESSPQLNLDAAAAIAEYEQNLANTENHIIDFLEHEHPEYAEEEESSSTPESEFMESTLQTNNKT